MKRRVRGEAVKRGARRSARDVQWRQEGARRRRAGGGGGRGRAVVVRSLEVRIVAGGRGGEVDVGGEVGGDDGGDGGLAVYATHHVGDCRKVRWGEGRAGERREGAGGEGT